MGLIFVLLASSTGSQINESQRLFEERRVCAEAHSESERCLEVYERVHEIEVRLNEYVLTRKR